MNCTMRHLSLAAALLASTVAYSLHAAELSPTAAAQHGGFNRSMQHIR
jgi:hypothetical protein